jgi:hypothetical protein
MENYLFSIQRETVRLCKESERGRRKERRKWREENRNTKVC